MLCLKNIAIMDDDIDECNHRKCLIIVIVLIIIAFLLGFYLRPKMSINPVDKMLHTASLRPRSSGL